MRVELAAEVFRDDDPTTGPYQPADLHRLIELLRCFAEQRHEWVTDAVVVVAVEQFLPKHVPSLAGSYVALARKAAVAVQAWTGTSQAGEVVRVTRADLADHAADLCQPAVVVVENQESDGYFLEAVAHVLGDQRIRNALRERWVEICNGGGSTLVKVAREAASRFRRVVRVSAVLDSDRLIPRQRTGSHDKADQLRRLDIAVHVLERREAENYVPYRVLARIGRAAEASERLKRLKQLTPQQREHYDMKHGFRRVDKSTDAAEAHQELFPDIDQRARRVLHDGFGTDLLKRLHDDRNGLTERDFAQLGDDVLTELRTMLATIAGKI